MFGDLVIKAFNLDRHSVVSVHVAPQGFILFLMNVNQGRLHESGRSEWSEPGVEPTLQHGKAIDVVRW